MTIEEIIKKNIKGIVFVEESNMIRYLALSKKPNDESTFPIPYISSYRIGQPDETIKALATIKNRTEGGEEVLIGLEKGSVSIGKHHNVLGNLIYLISGRIKTISKGDDNKNLHKIEPIDLSVIYQSPKGTIMIAGDRLKDDTNRELISLEELEKEGIDHIISLTQWDGRTYALVKDEKSSNDLNYLVEIVEQKGLTTIGAFVKKINIKNPYQIISHEGFIIAGRDGLYITDETRTGNQIVNENNKIKGSYENDIYSMSLIGHSENGSPIIIANSSKEGIIGLEIDPRKKDISDKVIIMEAPLYGAVNKISTIRDEKTHKRILEDYCRNA